MKQKKHVNTRFRTKNKMESSMQYEKIYIHKENTVSPVLMRGTKVTVRELDEEGVSEQ